MQLFSLIFLILGSPAWAGSGSGNVSNVVQYGGGAITSTTANGVPPQITIPISNLSSMVTLFGGTGSGSSNGYYGFYSASSPTSTAEYQVPSGKTFYVLGAYMAAGVGDPIQLGYATASFTEGTGSAPTGAIYYGSSSTTTNTPFIQTVAAPAYSWFPVGTSFPALSFPFWRPSASGDQNRLILMGIVQ